MKRVYISGPVTKEPRAHVRFMEVSEQLQDRYPDTEVINPILVQGILPRGTHEEYMSLCLPLLALCDAVYFMSGWRHSQGCCLERAAAIEKGLLIIDEDDVTAGGSGGHGYSGSQVQVMKAYEGILDE